MPVLPRRTARSACTLALAALVAGGAVGCSGALAGHPNPAPEPVASPTGYSTVVTNLHDAGPGSLRAAIVAANAHTAPGASATITFSVRGTIALASALPAIRVTATIDGSTAPGYAGSAPTVAIDARGHAGLVFASHSNGSALLAVAVGGAEGNGVTLEASSITLNHDYIGLRPTGKVLENGGDGVFVSAQSTHNTIGANPAGASGAVGNVISGNRGNGLSLHGSSLNTIVANRIGTNPAGTSAVPNGGNGIWMTAGSDDNEVGGTVYVDSATGQANDPTGDKGRTTPVFVVPPLGNLISGNAANGIAIDDASNGNTLNGNFIGTSVDGDAAIGNSGDGVRIERASGNALVGCQFVNNPFVYYNVVSGNGRNGLELVDANDVSVRGNFFGIGADNATILANRGDGILVDGTSRNAQIGGVIPLGNVASGNARNGIEVAGQAEGFTTFNTFGGLFAFKGAAPNGKDGLLLTATGGNQTVRTNVFSGNLDNGIEIAGDASGVLVDPNIAGLTTSGLAILPNAGDGLLIGGSAHRIVVGGYVHSVIPQNTFSGNRGYGIALVDDAHDIAIVNSYVGLTIFGNAARPNQLGGIYVGGNANHSRIGGSGTRLRPRKNLVSGNAGNGVTLDSGTSYIGVIGNWIGLDRKGHTLVPNQGLPIVVKPGSTNDVIRDNVTTVPPASVR